MGLRSHGIFVPGHKSRTWNWDKDPCSSLINPKELISDVLLVISGKIINFSEFNASNYPIEHICCPISRHLFFLAHFRFESKYSLYSNYFLFFFKSWFDSIKADVRDLLQKCKPAQQNSGKLFNLWNNNRLKIQDSLIVNVKLGDPWT